MQIILGYLCIIVGLAMEILAVLVWLGLIRPAPAERVLQQASVWDFLIELLRKAPWAAVVGLLLIYAGLKMIGVSLSF